MNANSIHVLHVYIYFIKTGLLSPFTFFLIIQRLFERSILLAKSNSFNYICLPLYDVTIARAKSVSIRIPLRLNFDN